MNAEERATLDAWAARLSGELGLQREGTGPNAVLAALDIDAILSLAGTAAHAVLRPAAPVTTFLVGYAAGLAAAAGTPPQDAISAASTTASAACARE